MKVQQWGQVRAELTVQPGAALMWALLGALQMEPQSGWLAWEPRLAVRLWVLRWATLLSGLQPGWQLWVPQWGWPL